VCTTSSRSVARSPRFLTCFAPTRASSGVCSRVAQADVDDVAQEVFVGVYRNLPNFEGRCSLRAWVYSICHRRAVDYRRRASARPTVSREEPEDQSEDASQERDLAMSEARHRLREFLETLDHEKRTVFVLCDIDGVPMEEVALVAGCSLQTAYSRLYAARRKLDSLLARLRLGSAFARPRGRASIDSTIPPGRPGP
jgi:RNA polymerase sigma-70 factor (ECF subfamily)